jgi:hypothetical protein
MFGPYTLLIPKTISEVRDKLGGMMLLSPTFQDITGYFPGRNIDNTFYELNEGLQLLRGKLGEELYLKLRDMSDQMRAHFESDPDKKTGGTLKGREIIMDMEDLLKEHSRKRRTRT